MQRWNAGILIFEDVEVLDFAGPYEILSRTRLEPGLESRRSDLTAPFRVFSVAPSKGVLRATGGLQLVPDFDLESAPRIDLLVVPGGFGTRALLDDPEVLAWIERRAHDARQVASVCTGALLLAKTGLLAGRKATTHWGALELLAGVDESIEVLRGERVVRDGVITSAGVAAGIDMALSVVEQICGKQVADETAHYVEYPRPATS